MLSLTGWCVCVYVCVCVCFDVLSVRAVVDKVWPTDQIWITPVFVNQVLLKHRHAHLFTHCL